jgi:hypothetical protein
VEVVIEGKCHFYIKLFHNDFACAICEAPILVLELLKYFPRQHQISGCKFVYFRKAMIERTSRLTTVRRFLSPRTLSNVSVSSTM